MRTCLSLLIALASTLATPASASTPAPSAAAPSQPAAAARCEHGVKKTVCTRCNPRLEPVFKAKGDWCPEHGRPESQCAKCNPALAREGVR